jgi:ATP-dependent DNA helicase DinG
MPDTDSLAVTRALGGKVRGIDLLRAHVDRYQGEHRPQQEQMVEAVADAIKSKHPLIVQAGTGTGKSLAYLFPLAASGCRGVIATATNQLSEQLMRYDLPKIQDSLAATGQDFTYALLKGRNNYACLAKIAEIENLDSEGAAHAGDSDSLFDFEPDDEVSATKRRQAKADAAQVGELLPWAKSTSTGDRSEAPVVSDRSWAQVSTGAADCPGASGCAFGDRCFTELARQKARQANIVVTNHALLAQDIKASLQPGSGDGSAPGASVFGKHDIIIADEAHDLPDNLTSALSSEVDTRALGKFVSKAAKHVHDTQINKDGESATIANIRDNLEQLEEHFESLPTGPLDTLPAPVVDLLNALVTRFIMLQTMLQEASGAAAGEKPKRAAAAGILFTQAGDYAAKLVAARTVGEGRVRWVDQRRPEDAPVLRTAPIEVGDALTKALEDRTLIATSATLTVGGNFEPIQRTLGLTAPKVVTLDVGSPFDYPSQGMLYIPKAPFPEPVGKDRTAHTEAVREEVLALVSAAGGRTLALFTTTVGAQRAAEYLREKLPHLTVHAHGDAPADTLVRQFAEEETSVLCATMGLWQGTNVEGASCSLVIIDKVAFAPVDDVLTAARRAHTDSLGRDGFNEVVVAQAATSLAQGAGRLIRTRSDKGVVAILDPRIHTKGYGRILLRSLPDFRVFTDRNVVIAALERLTGGTSAAQHATNAAEIKAYPKPAPKASGSNGHRGVRRASSTRNLANTTKPRPKKID